MKELLKVTNIREITHLRVQMGMSGFPTKTQVFKFKYSLIKILIFVN